MKAADRTARDQRRTVLLLSVVFLLGGGCGTLLSLWFPANESSAILLSGGMDLSLSPPVWIELLIALRWPVLILTGSVIPTAGILIPFLFFLRGCLLSYGISAVIWSGLHSAEVYCFLLFGPTCVFALPMFFLLGVACLTEILSGKPSKDRSRILLFSVPALLSCMVLDCRIVPLLLHQINGG